jgi:hypothetical protein
MIAFSAGGNALPRLSLAPPVRPALVFLAAIGCLSCSRSSELPKAAPDPWISERGSIELTAKLVEIPDGAIFKRDLYDYATVLKYQVLTVHRGNVDGETIYVGHYNPFKPRSEAADARVKDVGGDLKSFRAGQVHRMALEVPIDDHFMGGIVNKYFDQSKEPIYWAVQTHLVSE